MIRQGSVEVRIDDRPVAVLHAGEYFGETALLTGAKRNATVRALESTVVYALGTADFHATLESAATIRRELERTLFARQ